MATTLEALPVDLVPLPRFPRTGLLAHVLILLTVAATSVAFACGWLEYDRPSLSYDHATLFGRGAAMLPVGVCVVALAHLTRPTFSRRWLIGVGLAVLAGGSPHDWAGVTLIALVVLCRGSVYRHRLAAGIALTLVSPTYSAWDRSGEFVWVTGMRVIGCAWLVYLLVQAARDRRTVVQQPDVLHS